MAINDTGSMIPVSGMKLGDVFIDNDASNNPMIYQYDNDSILIDFNRAYNPKCVYDENFSCPIVPRENMLNTRIESGVKNFSKS